MESFIRTPNPITPNDSYRCLSVFILAPTRAVRREE